MPIHWTNNQSHSRKRTFPLESNGMLQCPYNLATSRVFVGYEAEGHGQRARLCCRLISDSIFWLFYFIPMLASRCNALPKKVPKELYKRKDQQQIRDEDVSFILSFIYWVQQPFHGWGSFSWIHWNGWIPQLRCKKKKYVNRFMHVFVLIWYFGLP